MEFPDLGQNCSNENCKQLDFLPVKCDACGKVFCKDHYSYAQHNCPEAYRKENQVPVCPLCNSPISVMKGQSADLVVGAHIDNDCQSDPALSKRKVSKNKCNVKGCKQKEVIPFNCNNCHKNFCVRHRLQEDHQCLGYQDSGRGMSKSGAAAIQRFDVSPRTANSSSVKSSNAASSSQRSQGLGSIGRQLDSDRRQRQAPVQNYAQVVQGNMSEDEAMAHALALSLNEQSTSNSERNQNEKQQQEDADLALAQALQQSETDGATSSANRQTRNREKDSNCHLS